MLTGSLGERVNEALGGALPLPWPEGAESIRLEGHLEGGGLPCYLPLWKRETFGGFVALRSQFAVAAPPDAPPIWADASRSLSYTIESSAVGFASCRALEESAVEAIVAKVREEGAQMVAF